jgi:hypothetical protein
MPVCHLSRCRSSAYASGTLFSAIPFFGQIFGQILLDKSFWTNPFGQILLGQILSYRVVDIPWTITFSSGWD